MSRIFITGSSDGLGILAAESLISEAGFPRFCWLWSSGFLGAMHLCNAKHQLIAQTLFYAAYCWGNTDESRER